MAKTALITGPTNGIGRETAKGLAQQGYDLYLLCRNKKAGDQLADELVKLGAVSAKVLHADLGDFAAVKAAAETFLADDKPLNVLINNAGIVNMDRIMVDGYEEMFRVNHLGHFLLTQLLLDRLKETEGSRIVVVASDAHTFCDGIKFDNLSFENNFATFKTYGQSKLANILMVRSLVKRLEGSGVIVNSLHPGAVSSQLGYNNKRWYSWIIQAITRLFFISPEAGAETSIYLATTDEVTTSNHYYYKKKTRGLKPWAKSDEDAEKLWDISMKAVEAYL